MSCPEPEQIVAAPPPPGFSTPTKADRNDGAAHAESNAARMETESDADVEKQFDESTGKKRTYHPYLVYTEIKSWATGEDSILDPAEIKREQYMLMKKFMQDSRLMKAPGHKTLDTDIAHWKLHRAEYYNSRQDEWIRVYKCPLHHRCRCQAKVRIITGKNYQRLEFYGTHDENSHANDGSKKLKHNQIVAIHDAVIVAPKQSAAVLRRNMMHIQGSPEQHKHIDPAKLRCVQRCVHTARQNLTKQKLAAATVPESLGELIEWCETNDFHAALLRHNDPADEYCLPLFSVFVIGHDIKPERQAIHVNLSSPWFLANAIRALEAGWIVQLNGDGTFGFCRAAVDMIGLGFCSMGGANHPACWSYIPHQGEGELMYHVTYNEMERAALALLTANLNKECEFTKYIKHLLAQPNVEKYMEGEKYRDGKLPIDQAQCDHQAGWRNFAWNVFGWAPNICSTHLTGKRHFFTYAI